MYEEENDSKPEIEESQYFPEEELFKEAKEERKKQHASKIKN